MDNVTRDNKKRTSHSSSTRKSNSRFQELCWHDDGHTVLHDTKQIHSLTNESKSGYFLVTLDSHGKILEASPNFIDIIGKKGEELIGKSILDYLHEQDRGDFICFLERLSHLPFCGHYEARIKHSGGWKRIFWFNEATLDERSDVVTIKCVGRDVTNRKRIAKALFETESRFHQIFDNVNNSIVIYEAADKGTDFIIKDYNQAAEKTTKVSRKEIVGRLVSEVFPDVKRLGLMKVFQSVWRTGTSKFYPAKLYDDGRIAFWTENYVFKLRSGEIVSIFEDVTERKQIEAQLRYNAELLESISDAVISIDKHLIIKSWNKGAEAIYGWRQNEVIEKKYNDVLKTKYCEGTELKRIVQKSVKQGIWESELIQKNRNGERIYILSRVTPNKDNSGNVVGVVMLNRDITEQKKKEREFLESQERYRAFFENGIDANIVTSPDGTIYSANEEACRIFGRSEEELCRIGRMGVVDAADPRLTLALQERARTGRFKGELNFKRKDGTIFPGEISSSIFHDSQGNTKTSMVIRDISDRKIMESALEESEERFQSFMNNSPAMAWMKDENGRYVYLSRTYEKKYEVKFADWQGKKDIEVWPEEIAREFIKNDSEVIKSGNAIEVIEKTRNCKGEVGYVFSFKFPFQDLSGKKYVGGIGVDITDRLETGEALKKSQEQLRQYSAYLQNLLESERKHLAAEIHDELGQMLTALKIDLSWLAKKLPPEMENLFQKTQSMIRLVDHSDKVVKRISSSLRPPILDDLGLAEAIKWLVAQFQERTGVKCVLRIPEKEISNKKQAIDIFRLIQEALTNVTRHSGASRVNINIRAEPSQIEVTIKDNGRGITESEINSHLSFGLMGMQERILNLKGKLNIEGKKDKGTTVKFMVPIEEQA